MTSVYLYTGLGEIVFGAELGVFAYFLIHNTVLMVCGLAFIVIGAATIQLPLQVTTSETMGILLEGSVLSNSALLDNLCSKKEVEANVFLGKEVPVEAEKLSHGTAGQSIYLPPDIDGTISLYVSFKTRTSHPDIEEMRNAPRAPTSGDQKEILLFPPGARLGKVPELVSEGTLLQDALDLILVKMTETCSYTTVSENDDIIILEIDSVKIRLETTEYSNLVGSFPVSLAACVIATVKNSMVMFVDERNFGARSVARFRVLRNRDNEKNMKGEEIVTI